MKCVVAQWKISSSLNERRPLPGEVEAHAARCPACRAFLEAGLAAEARLSAAAPGKTGSIAAGVVAAIQAGEKPRALDPWRPAAWAGAFAAAAAALALMIVRPAAMTPSAAVPAPSTPWAVVDRTTEAAAQIYRDEQQRLLRDAADARDFLLACLVISPPTAK